MDTTATRGGGGEGVRPEPLARREHGVAGADVTAATSDERARGGGGVEHLDGAEGVGEAAGGVLERDDGVSARRHGGSGHDPHRLARPERGVVGRPGRQIGDDAQRHRALGIRPLDVGEADGEPVHRGVVVAGEVVPGADVGRERPSRRLVQPDRLDGQGVHGGEDAGAVLFDGQQLRHAGSFRRGG